WLLGLAVATTVLSANPAPASAAAGGAFKGTLTINCFGCGASSGRATLKATGTIAGKRIVQAPLTMSFTFYSSLATCPVQGQATGTYSGAADGYFGANFGPTGATFGIVSFTGEINGVGTISLASTTPDVISCGQPLSATVVGEFAGT
ncbi:MAG: hypothetical protein QOJ03_469, partial [Frankiaceae bacterium]|nr:hypothetical protein [Frankiaceae bacterium]